MARHIALAAVCSLCVGPVALGGQNLGALRQGNGGATAIAQSYGYAYDPATGYTYAYGYDRVADINEEMQANAAAGINIADGGASGTESVIAQSLITGPVNSVVYVPEAAVGVGHQVSAMTQAGCYGCSVGVGGVGLNQGFGLGTASDTYLIDDSQADCPCLTGFLDIIVTTQRMGTANTGGYVDVWVDKAEINNQTQGQYDVYWDGNVVLTIYTPDGGDINMIMEIVDCDYNNPVPLGSYGATNSGYGYGTYAFAYGDNDLGNQAMAGISVTSWFEVNDFTCGTEPNSPTGSIQNYVGEDEDRQASGDPTEVTLESGGGGY